MKIEFNVEMSLKEMRFLKQTADAEAKASAEDEAFDKKFEDNAKYIAGLRKQIKEDQARFDKKWKAREAKSVEFRKKMDADRAAFDKMWDERKERMEAKESPASL